MAIRDNSIVTLGQLNRILKCTTYLKQKEIYGLEVDFDNMTYTRLGNAVGKKGGDDFDGISPWNRRRCNLTDDGVVTAYLGDDGYTETGFLENEITVNGTVYPVGTPVQVMVEQPKFYYKVVPLELGSNEENGYGYNLKKAQYYVSPTKVPGFKLHPAFIENGHENDRIFLSAYVSSVYDTSSEQYNSDYNFSKKHTKDELETFDKYKLCSVSGKYGIRYVESYEDYEYMRKPIDIMAHNRGSGWETVYIATFEASRLLMLIEYARFDVEKVIGSVSEPTSNYMTGAAKSFGNKSGKENKMSSYRGEEGIFALGNPLNGIYFPIFGEDGNHKSQYYIADHEFDNALPPKTYPADNPLIRAPEPVPPYKATGISAPNITVDLDNDKPSADYTLQCNYKYFGYSYDYDWLFVPSSGDLGENNIRFFGMVYGIDSLKNRTGVFMLFSVPTEIDAYLWPAYFYMMGGEDITLLPDYVFHRLVFIPSKV